MPPPRDNPPVLPFKSELPGRLGWLRVAAHGLLIAALVAVCVQTQVRSARNEADGRKADRAYYAALAAWRKEATESNRLAAVKAAWAARTVKRSTGAILRWRRAVRQFWAGENIYVPLRGGDVADPLTGRLLPGKSRPPKLPLRLGAPAAELADRPVRLHPNMPFVVILLSAFAWLSPQAALAAVNSLKLLALLGAILAAAAAANHRRHRMDEWVLGLAVQIALPLILSDIQHVNTNTFVLAALAGHLWLFRRGHDAGAGALLALAVCLKMTPLLFGVYWLVQRNWRLLGGLIGSLVVMVVLIPLAVMGYSRYVELTGSWLGNLIIPGALTGRPYPVHINQSLWGVFSRLFMRGNIYYNPEDLAVADKFGYINVIALGPHAGRVVLTALKLAVVAVMAWAIGWAKLARDDARRPIQYGLVAAAMLILNQRTWDHHAVILLIAYAGIWYALAYGRLGRRCRIGCTVAMLLAGAANWLMGKDLFVVLAGRHRGKELADVVEAYGPTFLHFLLIFILCVVLLRALRAADRAAQPLFARQRQPLSKKASDGADRP